MKHSTKKIGLVLVTVLMGFSLIGCQNNQQVPDQEQKPLDRRIGLISSLGTVSPTQGTHILTLEDGSTILLRSLGINLDDSKYKAKVVEVGGLLNYTSDNKQIMEVQNIDILDDAAPTQEIIKITWKDYESSFGFSVRYRDDFEVSEEPEGVRFTREVVEKDKTQEEMETPFTQTLTQTTAIKIPEHQITFRLLGVTTKKALAASLELKNENSSAGELLAAGFTQSKIGPFGLLGYKRVSNDGTRIDFFVGAEPKFYQITFFGQKDEQFLEDQNIFYEMLTTFQLDQSSGQTQTPGTQIFQPVPATPPPVPQTQTQTSQTQADTQQNPPATQVPTQESQESQESSEIPQVTGYSLFESLKAKFTLQYPKSWYYQAGATAESGVSAHYDFGTKPLDEQPGIVGLDVLSGGTIPAGTTVNAGSKTVTKVSKGSDVEVYLKGTGSRVYRIIGPASLMDVYLNMASTLQD